MRDQVFLSVLTILFGASVAHKATAPDTKRMTDWYSFFAEGLVLVFIAW
jgi:hypothetical protein